MFWHLLSNIKTSWRFFQIFVAFSENLNFMRANLALTKQYKATCRYISSETFLKMFNIKWWEMIQNETICNCFMVQIISESLFFYHLSICWKYDRHFEVELALKKEWWNTYKTFIFWNIPDDYFDDKLPSKSSKMAAKVRVILKSGFNSWTLMYYLNLNSRTESRNSNLKRNLLHFSLESNSVPKSCFWMKS